MDLNLGGIKDKLLDNAEWVALILSAYDRFNGDINEIIKHYTSFSPGYGVMRQTTNSLQSFEVLRWKLLDAGHLYNSLFKISLGARISMEIIDIIPAKYKKPLEKIILGSAIAAITLPSSEPPSSSGNSGSGRSEVRGL